MSDMIINTYRDPSSGNWICAFRFVGDRLWHRAYVGGSAEQAAAVHNALCKVDEVTRVEESRP